MQPGRHGQEKTCFGGGSPSACLSLEEAGAHALIMTLTLIQKTRVRRVGEGRAGAFALGIYARLVKVGAQSLFENASFGEVAPVLMLA